MYDALMKKVITLASIYLVIGALGWFYIVHPSLTRKKCSSIGISHAEKVHTYASEEESYDLNYTACMHNNGL